MLRKLKLSKFALVFALTLFSATAALTQTGSNGQSRVRTKQLHRKSALVFQLSGELKQQQKFLRDIAARYEAVSVYDFTPLFSYTYVWGALREYRGRLIDPRRGFTAEQVKLIKDGYELLEADVVLRFVDHQLGVMDETLELDESQYDQVEKILSADLHQKRALLSTQDLSSKEFLQRIQRVSHASEKNILAVLTPEQRKNFYRQVGLNRERLIA